MKLMEYYSTQIRIGLLNNTPSHTHTEYNSMLLVAEACSNQFNPFPPSVPIWHRLEKTFDFNFYKGSSKIFPISVATMSR